LQRSWEVAKKVKDVQRVVIATDDIRIKDHAEDFGAEVIMTSENCKNGTERCAEALNYLEGEYDLVINFQGDAPLTPSWFVTDLINALKANKCFSVATPALKCDIGMVEDLLRDRKNSLVGGTTVVFSKNRSALYFSKEVIPFASLDLLKQQKVVIYHHVGVYAYRADVLKEYTSWENGKLELAEGLEQLRFLENNKKILCVESDSKGQKFWELNNPEDLEKIEQFLYKMGVD
jgi:3-deoxy-manno-octulosonate cytidylyltransferase (CMP-KDO synthetase)